jgi:hypothetical protein
MSDCQHRNWKDIDEQLSSCSLTYSGALEPNQCRGLRKFEIIVFSKNAQSKLVLQAIGIQKCKKTYDVTQ